MRIASNGNVGIGITTPSYKLQVGGDIYTSGDLLVGTGNAASWHRVSIQTGGFLAQDGNKGIGVYADGNANSEELFAYNYSTSAYIPLKIRTSTLNIQNGSGNSVIYHNGTNVGIGTSAPTARLDTYGVRVGRDFSIANRATVRLDSNTADYPADILFGHTAAANESSWTGVYWSLSSRANDASNKFYIYRGGGNPGGSGEAVIMALQPNGNIGIGSTAPAYLLDVSGTIRATGDVIAYSDARVKENIVTLENSLELVQKLRGVSYNKIGESEKKIGVIAQEVLEVLPEVVQQDSEGTYSVAYGNITAVLIEAIKQQQLQIDELKLEIKQLKG
jgi:hypothetical protein